MVALKNPHKRSVTFALTHPEAPKASTAFVQTLHDGKTGELAQRKIALSLPDTVTVLAGETRSDLPEYVVADAVRAGLVLVEEEAPREPQADGESAEDADKPQNALKRKKGGA